jgi:hypothetical protein
VHCTGLWSTSHVFLIDDRQELGSRRLLPSLVPVTLFDDVLFRLGTDDKRPAHLSPSQPFPYFLPWTTGRRVCVSSGEPSVKFLSVAFGYLRLVNRGEALKSRR